MGRRTKQSQEVHESINGVLVNAHVNKTPVQPQFFLLDTLRSWLFGLGSSAFTTQARFLGRGLPT